MNLYGELIRAQLHNSASDLTSPVTGLIYANTSSHVAKVYLNAGWKTLVDLTTSQVLTAKDYDGGTASDTSRITVPKAAFSTLTGLTRKQGTIVYDTDSNSLFSDDGSALNAIGTGSGSGGINYITNNAAESGTTGWITYDDAAAAPVDGTGGTVSTTWARSTSSPLRGAGSFLLTKDAANRQGEGASYAFTLHAADKSKVMKISFDVDATDANYVDDDILIYVYDVANSTVISPAFQKIKRAAYTFETTFVTTSSTSYRFIIHYATTNASAVAVKFDNFLVGPQTSVTGLPYRESFSIAVTTAFSTNNTITSLATRVGNMLYVESYVSFSGAPAAGTGVLTLPSGYTIDTTKLVSTSATDAVVGHVVAYDNSITEPRVGDVLYNSTTSVVAKIYIESNVDANYNEYEAITTTQPFVWAASDKMRVNFAVPIVEWAGSASYLSDTQPEFVSNSGTWDAADTTSFAYGASGTIMGGALTASRTKRVRFLQPIQVSDTIIVQGSYDRLSWMDINGSSLNALIVIPSADAAGTTFSGVSWTYVSGSTTDIDITFGRYINLANDDSPATAWPSSNAYWRVVKIPGSVKVASPTTVKYQHKALSADITAVGTTNFLTFSNLVVGRTYRFSGCVNLGIKSADSVDLYLVVNTTTKLKHYQLGFGSPDQVVAVPFNHIFVATQTTVGLRVENLTGGAELINGDTTSGDRTWAILEELPTHVATTDWT